MDPIVCVCVCERHKALWRHAQVPPCIEARECCSSFYYGSTREEGRGKISSLSQASAGSNCKVLWSSIPSGRMGVAGGGRGQQLWLGEYSLVEGG